jgi:hypothetical protein
MRFMIRLIVLGFAGFGMYRAWELVGPKVEEARQRVAGARERIEPALQDAAESLQAATADVAQELTADSRDLDQVAPDAFGTAAEKVSSAPKPAQS